MRILDSGFSRTVRERCVVLCAAEQWSCRRHEKRGGKSLYVSVRNAQVRFWYKTCMQKNRRTLRKRKKTSRTLNGTLPAVHQWEVMDRPTVMKILAQALLSIFECQRHRGAQVCSARRLRGCCSPQRQRVNAYGRPPPSYSLFSTSRPPFPFW